LLVGIGMTSFSFAFEGWMIKKLRIWQRLLIFISALLITSGFEMKLKLIAFTIIILILFYQLTERYIQRKKMRSI